MLALISEAKSQHMLALISEAKSHHMLARISDALSKIQDYKTWKCEVCSRVYLCNIYWSIPL